MAQCRDNVGALLARTVVLVILPLDLDTFESVKSLAIANSVQLDSNDLTSPIRSSYFCSLSGVDFQSQDSCISKISNNWKTLFKTCPFNRSLGSHRLVALLAFLKYPLHVTY